MVLKIVHNQMTLVRGLSQISNKSKWKSVVGLEVHAQINSASKLFSGASTQFSSPVNTNVSLFDCSTPGTLPVLNKRSVEAGVLTALSLNCKVNPVSHFDRKHYFYADLPNGYQITQQRAPLAVGGYLEFQVFTPGIHKVPYTTKVKIKQLQLEQDSGKSLHDENKSFVDLNRAGVSLMELVFDPDLKDGEEAAALVKELISILQRIQTCTCKMEEGALRVDANVSIHKESEPLGVRTEIKNIGSVRGVAGAVSYEIRRQIKLKEAGQTITNETRAWDASSKTTVAMRDKEVEQDYRYMPEPNLPPLHIAMGPIQLGSVNADELKKCIPELPEETRQRLRKENGLTLEQSIILVNDSPLLKVFEEISAKKVSAKLAANFLINDVNTMLNKKDMDSKEIINPGHIGEILELLEREDINRNTARILLENVLSGNDQNPNQIVKEKDLLQISDETELKNICIQVIEENKKAVRDYKAGKTKAFKALLGAVVSKSKSRANMKKIIVILKDLLEN
ncbi:glutamyl-tRNA(Gln) amidotransferase subunit B, mitochondrial [Diorhabda carinulata]|uniref:glutamyl-tRNA(Gln) amidotransferase subunit B, mitochondrial n=1 Tax=Diorhabda carinulata TaxID=1163345 RepID=UPI0025A286DE|nr:glutamyl-tRNA(Gln) amidotransferase subunit B, mitochondrial [Diorhabda carinulata]XP_057662675.1 glutamyl-tRNA(Gln) amidotransferase subunit B, mitochondrial [Diorhabda carinulata]